MTSPTVRLGALLAAGALALGACGGSNSKPAPKKKAAGPPPGAQVQDTVVAMLDK